MPSGKKSTLELLKQLVCPQMQPACQPCHELRCECRFEPTAPLHLDSLARVRLLIALRTRLPDPPEITVTEICEFRTIGELVDAIEGRPATAHHTPAPLAVTGVRPPAGSRDPLAWLIEQFAATSAATTLRDVSLLRDPGTATGPITVRCQEKRLALVSDVVHGRARIAEPSAPNPVAPTKIVTVRGGHALDECVRAAVRWAGEEFGGTATAMGVREVRLHSTDLAAPGKAELAGRVKNGRAECDVALKDPDGSARVVLRGVQLLRHPR